MSAFKFDKERASTINKEILKLQKEFEEEKGNREEWEPLIDGAINPQRYESQKLHILFLGKDAYIDKDKDGRPIGKGNYSELIYGDVGGIKKHPNLIQPTHRKLILVAYFVLQNIPFAEKPKARQIMEDSKENNSILNIEDIAIINIEKMPRESTSDEMKDLESFEKVWKSVISEQLDYYDPDVIITGGETPFRALQILYGNQLQNDKDYKGRYLITNEFQFAENNPELDNQESYINCYIIENNNKKPVIILWGYHPQSTKTTHETYVESIRISTYEMLKKYNSSLLKQILNSSNS